MRLVRERYLMRLPRFSALFDLGLPLPRLLMTYCLGMLANTVATEVWILQWFVAEDCPRPVSNRDACLAASSLLLAPPILHCQAVAFRCGRSTIGRVKFPPTGMRRENSAAALLLIGFNLTSDRASCNRPPQSIGVVLGPYRADGVNEAERRCKLEHYPRAIPENGLQIFR